MTTRGRAGILAAAMLLGCAPGGGLGSASPASCAQTPTSSVVLPAPSPHVRWGVRAGDAFFLISGSNGERPVFKAAPAPAAKVALIFDPPLATAPRAVRVEAREPGSATTVSTTMDQYASDEGAGWIGSFAFPRAGCWQLRVVDPTGTAPVIVLVTN